MRIAIVALLGLAGCKEEPRTYSTRGAGGEVIFSDDFERAELGVDWKETGSGALIENGVLKLRDVQNHPVWLARELPPDFRVEFDAWATSDEGDIKVELCGDGKSFATQPNYIASGYVVIFGGWNNTLSAIVRRNEHGRERVTTGEPKVEPDRRYHFSITRSSSEILVELDGEELLTFDDKQPLRGSRQSFFAFSGWEAETHFDNLVIEKLPGAEAG